LPLPESRKEYLHTGSCSIWRPHPGQNMSARSITSGSCGMEPLPMDMAKCLTQPDIISNMEITLWPVYELVDLLETFVLVYMDLPHGSCHVLLLKSNSWKMNNCHLHQHICFTKCQAPECYYTVPSLLSPHADARHEHTHHITQL